MFINANSLLVNFATVFGADEGRDGNVLVLESEPRREDAAAVERFGVTVATLARRFSDAHNIDKDRCTTVHATVTALIRLSTNATSYSSDKITL